MCVNVKNSDSAKFVYNWNLSTVEICQQLEWVKVTNLPNSGLSQIKDQVNPMWTIYNTLELDSECGFYSLIRLFQLTMSVSDPWLITKVNDTGLTPRQLLICLLLNVIVISWLYIKNVGHILSYIYTTHASRHCRDPPHTVIFFFGIALARYTNFALRIFGFPSLPLLFTSEKN